jgi:large subunit ribosomal protein L20
MPRAKNKAASHRRRKRVLKAAKGYWGARSKVYTIAKTHVEKGWSHAYVGRKLKKRRYRAIWIVRINAAARANGTTYSRLINALNKAHILINRKLLADLAANHPDGFAEVVKTAVGAK